MYSGPLFLNLEYLYLQVYNLLTSAGGWATVKLIGWLLWWGLVIVTPIFLWRIFYWTRTIREARRGYVGNLSRVPVAALTPRENKSWQKVEQLIASTNPSDWQLAIIEADKMLDELLKSMQYRGDSLGEKLKAVEPSDFTSLDQAWSAHKVRNQIAHEPGFVLTDRLARQTIADYRTVFEEFELI